MTNVSTNPSYQQLPIIDLSAADRGPQARALLRAQLHSAAHDVGFFQLVGHGVSREEVGSLLSAMRRFFALPEAERLAIDHRVVSPPGATERFSVPFFYNPRLDARVEPLSFPYASAAPGVSDDPTNPLFAEYGYNELKGKLRAHPLVAERHHGDLLTPA
ncbi:2-oxoglutarate and iron-dependent oxygenase domain-containing protein [Streptomyces sp. NBC_00019]|uniref:2-oxoglutarate and iron-dependent oxygenase domain-containing protein n=1 Tax=Streptomyces sp. NBC_00019 TaxID=2975623 RepID=UPI00324392E1